MKEVNRIKHYESLLNDGEKIVKNLNEAIDSFLAFKDKYKELDKYLNSDERESDIKLDMEGKLPKDLLTGVLAEDYLWDFLESYEELLNKIE